MSPGDLEASTTLARTAFVYDVRQGDPGDYDVTHVVGAGTVVPGEADVVNQAPVALRLQVDFVEGGPLVEKELTANYCPAFAALTQLWAR